MSDRKLRLYAGTINRHPDTEEWHNLHLDASPRDIWDPELERPVAPDFVANLADELPMFADDTFDEIVCHHVLEHMTYGQATLALRAMYRVLKPGGSLDVETPDMQRIAEGWVNKTYTESDLQQWIHGEDLGGDFDGHRYSWSADSLAKLLRQEGFKHGQREETGLAVRYVAHKPT